MMRLLIALLIWAYALSAAAANTFTIGIEDTESMPIHSTKGEGFPHQNAGYVVDLLGDFAKKNNYTLIWKPLPIKRLMLDYLKEGSTIDFKYPDNQDWDSQAKHNVSLVYSDPLFIMHEGMMVLPNRADVHEPSELKSIGMVLGFSLAEPYQSLVAAKKITLSEASGTTNLIEMTLLGRVDAAFVGKDVAQYILSSKLKKPNALVFNDHLPFVESKFTLSAKKSSSHDEVIQKLNNYLRTDISFQQSLKNKYGIVSQ
jgi:ABC-type amino acid transport substrate-binding protein